LINFQSKSYEELLTDELYDILTLRQEVFIVEQDCPYLDNDGLDKSSLHIIGTQNEKVVAYARILPKSIQYKDYTAIGRVVTSKSIRGQKIGQKLFDYALKTCLDLYPEYQIKLSSQVYIKKFYADFGFEEIGDAYLEDDIPHIAMVYKKHL